jgi:hypothetical protein
MKRAAIYLRVSSDEQTYENQRSEVERVAQTRGYRVVAVYEEHVSAAKDRPAFARAMEDAHRGQFDVLVMWALDPSGERWSVTCRRDPQPRGTPSGTWVVPQADHYGTGSGADTALEPDD